MLYILLAIIAVLFIIVTVLYNSLIMKKNDVENAFASIDVMLKRRYDLIPALVDAVKGYMDHERKLLTEISALRAKAVAGGISNDERVIVENNIRKALSDIMVAVENYPDLKASQNFLKLQGSINEAEEQLSASRRAFNAAVTIFNNSVEVFPSNIMASIINFRRRTLFEVPESEKARPDVTPLTGSS